MLLQKPYRIRSTELIITTLNVFQTMKMYGKMEVQFHIVLFPRDKTQKSKIFE